MLSLPQPHRLTWSISRYRGAGITFILGNPVFFLFDKERIYMNSFEYVPIHLNTYVSLRLCTFEFVWTLLNTFQYIIQPLCSLWSASGPVSRQSPGSLRAASRQPPGSLRAASGQPPGSKIPDSLHAAASSQPLGSQYVTSNLAGLTFSIYFCLHTGRPRSHFVAVFRWPCQVLAGHKISNRSKVGFAGHVCRVKRRKEENEKIQKWKVFPYWWQKCLNKGHHTMNAS